MDPILFMEVEEEATTASVDSADAEDMGAEDLHLETHITNNSQTDYRLQIRQRWLPDNHKLRDRIPGIITPINPINNRATMAVITIKTTTAGTDETPTQKGAVIIIKKRIR